MEEEGTAHEEKEVRERTLKDNFWLLLNYFPFVFLYQFQKLFM